MARPIIALLYDFDKTLCTTDMENYTFIPELGYTPAQFWQKANSFGRDNHMDGLLAYMYTMIHECREQNRRLDRDFLVRCGRWGCCRKTARAGDPCHGCWRSTTGRRESPTISPRCIGWTRSWEE